MTRLSDPAQLSGLLGIPFSDQQLAAITAPLEPGVIIAGAGSGKTTVMAARVVWLVGSGAVLPEQVLGLTFTRKAAAELSGRVRAALVSAGLAEDEAEPGEELVATYDSFAGRLVAEYGLLLGIEPGLRTLTGAGRFRLAAQAVADPPAALQSLTRLRPASVAALVVEFSAELGSHLVEPADLDQHAERFLTALDQAPRNRTGAEYAALARARAITAERRELASLVTRYEELKAERGYVEFADQLAQAARLATELPSVQRALRAEFGVVLLDEYQDTSAAQARLLRGLFSGPDPSHGRGHPVTAVGDPCQAIYGWRGAAASNILQFATDFPTAAGTPARAYALTVNRRSGQRVLTAANALAAPVRDIPELAATGLDLELVCPAGTPAARIETAEFATWPQEVAWLADQVVGQHDAGEVEHWSDIAVLTRRNAQIAAVYAELVSRGVPVEIVGLGGLLDLPAVAEVVATLRLVADPCDNPALVRLLTSPRWAIGLADLTLLGSRAGQLAGRPQAPDDPTVDDAVRAVLTGADPAAQPSLLEAVESPGEAGYSAAARQRFAAFSAEFAGLRRSASESVVDLVRRIIDTLGVEVELLAQGEDPAPLATFVRAVADFVELEDASTLPGLLAWLEDERDHGVGLEQAVVSAADSVKLLTVHKAKGLEWEVVFLPALAAGVFPGDRVTGNWLANAAVLPAPLRGDAAAVPQLAEVSNAGVTGFGEALKQDNRLGEDRLAYVAVTRARRRLYGSSHAWDEGLTRPRQPSAYLAVLHEHADHRLLPEAVPDQNPLAPDGGGSPWPVVDDGERWQQRRRAAAMVTEALAELRAGQEPAAPADLDLAEQLASWQRWRETLLTQARADARRPAPAPSYLSVTGVGRLLHDRAGFEADLLRPMPRLVGAQQRAGIGFHRWLEQRFSAQAPLVDDLEVEFGEVDDALREAFLAGPYADAAPLAVEVPFTLLLSGRLVRGRIDAVFPGADGFGYQVVDWKTGQAGRADPLQLAHYRLAWAELQGVPVEQVDAVFYEVVSGRVLRPTRLGGRSELESLAARLPGGDSLSP